MRHKVKRIHFVGIGGSGMSGIAEVLANLGYTVTGSDLSESPPVRRLRQMGIKVVVGHAADNVAQADANCGVSDLPDLPPALLERLHRHAWRRSFWYAGK